MVVVWKLVWKRSLSIFMWFYSPTQSGLDWVGQLIPQSKLILDIALAPCKQAKQYRVQGRSVVISQRVWQWICLPPKRCIPFWQQNGSFKVAFSGAVCRHRVFRRNTLADLFLLKGQYGINMTYKRRYLII